MTSLSSPKYRISLYLEHGPSPLGQATVIKFTKSVSKQINPFAQSVNKNTRVATVVVGPHYTGTGLIRALSWDVTTLYSRGGRCVKLVYVLLPRSIAGEFQSGLVWSSNLPWNRLECLWMESKLVTSVQNVHFYSVFFLCHNYPEEAWIYKNIW